MNVQQKLSVGILVAVCLLPYSQGVAEGAGEVSVPQGWVIVWGGDRSSGNQAYFTGVDRQKEIRILVRAFDGQGKSAWQWAADKAERFLSNGDEILFPPEEVMIGAVPWVKLIVLLHVKGIGHKVISVLSEEYLMMAPNGGIIEVSATGSEANFSVSHRKGVQEFLASLAGAVAGGDTLPATAVDLRSLFRSTNARLEEELLERTTGLGLSEEQRKAFYREFLRVKREIFKEVRARFPEPSLEQDQYRADMDQNRLSPLLARYGLKELNIQDILYEARLKQWDTGTER